jgi:hypothetical protein
MKTEVRSTEEVKRKFWELNNRVRNEAGRGMGRRQRDDLLLSGR